jgi:undecaprenyl diphosphate synthase
MRRFLEKQKMVSPETYSPYEVVLLVYIPIFVVNVNGCLLEYFLSDSYVELIKRVEFDLDIKIKTWNDLKKVIWEELNLFPGLILMGQVIKSLFMVLTRAILLLKLRPLICVDGFIPENLELGEDIFVTFLGSYKDSTVPEIRHCILTIMMMENQTLFKPNELSKDPKDRKTSRFSKRIYEDGGKLLGQMCVFYDFMPCGVHLGIIMDGNRRWGKERNLPGHFFGTKKTEEVLRWFQRIGNLEELTLYCLSIDNLEKRDNLEIDNLEQLLQIYLQQLIEAGETLSREIEIVVIGEVHRLSEKTVGLIGRLHEEYYYRSNAKNEKAKRRRLNLAIAYDALKESERTLAKIYNGNQSQVLEKLDFYNTSKNYPFDRYAYADQNLDFSSENLNIRKPIDYVIRCGNVMRTSGFFPLHTIYSEWIFLPLLWPDMTYEKLLICLKELGERSRRYGK